MDESDQLARVGDFLYSDGSPLDGFMGGEEAANAEVRRRYPNKPFCLVQRWMLVDLIVGDRLRAEIETSGLLRQLVYAHEVVFDSAGRFLAGDWVRSSLGLASPKDGFFETRNTVYVLLGCGCTKRAEYGVVFSIH